MARKNVGLRPRLRQTDGDRWVFYLPNPLSIPEVVRDFFCAISAKGTASQPRPSACWRACSTSTAPMRSWNSARCRWTSASLRFGYLAMTRARRSSSLRRRQQVGDSASSGASDAVFLEHEPGAGRRASRPYGASSPCASRPSRPPTALDPEDLLQLHRHRRVELLVGAGRRLAVGTPALEPGGVTETVALEVLVGDLGDELDAQRLPAQVLAAGSSGSARPGRR